MGADTETAPRVSRQANTRGALTTEVTVIHEEHNAKTEGRSVPTHEKIRRDAAAHPERSYSEHVQAARAIAGEQYQEDLRRLLSRGR